MEFVTETEDLTTCNGCGVDSDTVDPQEARMKYSATETFSQVTSSPISVTRIVLCSLLFVVVIVTVFGNLMVLLAPIVERKLRNSLTYLIMNLAITDFLVAVMAMSFYTFDVLLGE